ncbi:hypothetical protein CAOG_05191 [Capsaspora owczarzaki ATCC 30864]|nr:hypothetical protein CAOG_05191 [Capsaspora owczarzaki ATCC 30864]|eukprot:XP_004346876.1 hypothetical protein CAOG_05191 [Capsaspora owczarzaki ATCC 30864]
MEFFNTLLVRFGPLGRSIVALAVFDMFVCTAFFLLSADESSSRNSYWTNNFEHYDIRVSLFDLLALSAARALSLTACYTVLRLVHWLPLVLVASVSLAFTVAKFILIQHFGSGNWVPLCLLILSLIFPCMDIWLWLSQRHLQVTFLKLNAHQPSERTPLLKNDNSTINVVVDRSSSELPSGAMSPPRDVLPPKDLLRKPSTSSVSALEYFTPSEDSFDARMRSRSYAQQEPEHEAEKTTRAVPTPANTRSEHRNNAAIDDDGPSYRSPVVSPVDGQSLSRFPPLRTRERSMTVSDADLLAAGSDGSDVGIRNALQMAMQRVRKDAFDTRLWEFVTEELDVSIYQHKSSDSVKQMKGVSMMPHPPRKVLECIMALEKQREWNSTIESVELVTKYDDRCQVVHAAFKPTWPLKPRDFVYVQGWTEYGSESDGYLMASQSVVVPSVPETEAYTRGDIIASGFIIEPLAGDTNACMVVHIVAVNVKGAIPQGIAGMALTDRPLVLAGIHKLLAAEEEAEASRAQRVAFA